VINPPDGGKMRFNEKLDHLQARHPFRYNLATGALIGIVLVLIGFEPVVAVTFALSWAALRGFLWGEGRILRRQYEARVVRVAAEKAAKRRRS
jgi:hypothetical protein